MRRLVVLLLVVPAAGAADILVPARTIRAREVIVAADIARRPADVAGAIDDLRALVGQEARVVLYPGRPIRPGDVGPPALVDRNDPVTLVFRGAGLRISAEGRALGRGAAGEVIRVMNLSSRVTLAGRIRPDGSIEVQP